MSRTGKLHSVCSHCGAGITFQIQQIGETVPCPHCEKPTELVLALPEVVSPVSRRRIILAVSTMVFLLVCLVLSIVALKLSAKKFSNQPNSPGAGAPGVTNAESAPGN